MARATVGGSRAVETYLRNFEGEKSRYQEILEVTLCYGVQCLARTFSLKGISCNELRAITNYDTAKTRDFYVRNASRPIDKGTHMMARTPVEVRTKPSHSWRDGEEEMSDFPESSEAIPKQKAVIGSEAGANTEALYYLPPAFDEIDFHTKLLGKQFVDMAWKIFTGRNKAQIATKQELEEKFVRVDQRKNVTMIPAVEFPVTSFAEFLGAYVLESVRQAHRTGHDESFGSGEEDVANGEKESIYGCQASDSCSSSDRWGRYASTPRAAMGNTKSRQSPRRDAERKQRHLHPQPQPQQRQPRQVPRSLQHVQSKIQPELDARRQKILRVKKTQSQRMAETLTRARLAEYDARRELQDAHDRRLGPKKMPISEITKGAAALEIVDDFMKSPLMDKFGREDLSGLKQPTTGPGQQRSAQKDPLKEELYGTAVLDSSFLGCKLAPEPRRRSESQPKQPRRNYNGWLGDFGPLHTKTVRPEWDEAGSNADDPEPRTTGGGGAKYEWNFEHLPGGRHETVDRPKPQPKKTKGRAQLEENKNYKGVKRMIDDFNDDLSDGLSVNSDPVFRWLKDAV